MKNLWEIWPGAISANWCDYIIERAKLAPEQQATIGFDPNKPPEKSYRRSTIRWLDVQGKHADIAASLMQFINRSNRTNFGFDITTMNEIQYTEYLGTENGHYDWHHDVFWENTMPFDRKLSIIVQLSDPNDYKGGQFEFFGMESPNPLQWNLRGSVLVFPSFFHHRVLPVTEGKRVSLVSWIEGPKFR
jgi:PKHD-type hydroxylase